jgi:O-methyltransferase
MARLDHDFFLPMRVDFPTDLGAIWSRFAPYTMIPEFRFYDNLALMRHFAARVEGTFVECGVWRGGMSAAMIAIGGPSRFYHFFDSFEGLPMASEIDGPRALEWQSSQTSNQHPDYRDNCAVDVNEVKRLIESQPLDPGHAFVHKGWFKDTVPHQAKEPIAVLRLDGDWYESTIVCLEHLYPRVQRGGLVIIDDYETFDGCSRAVHDYLSRIQSTAIIDRTAAGRVTYLIKSD